MVLVLKCRTLYNCLKIYFRSPTLRRTLIRKGQTERAQAELHVIKEENQNLKQALELLGRERGREDPRGWEGQWEGGSWRDRKGGRYREMEGGMRRRGR